MTTKNADGLTTIDISLRTAGPLTALALLLAIGCGNADTAPSDDRSTSAPPVAGGRPGEPHGAPEPPAVGGKPVDGIFVSASRGADTNDASPLRPLKTLGIAIDRARLTQLPVIACAETYAEQVMVPDGVTMFGYFDCVGEDWKRIPARAKIVAPESPAVLIGKSVHGARFEGFEVIAPDMTGEAKRGTSAASSYGMFVHGSKGLHIADVKVVAGKGQDGVDGEEPASGNEELWDPRGINARGQMRCSYADPNHCVFMAGFVVSGSKGGFSQCKIGPSGGRGGNGGSGPVYLDGGVRYELTAQEKSGYPYASGTADTAVGGSGSGTLASTSGADGAPGASGANGATGRWSFAATGFIPADGTPGQNGAPGQGGGGGGGTDRIWKSYTLVARPLDIGPGVMWGATGAGGGAGGCGGIAGTAGTGGGASIALFVTGSEDIAIAHSVLESTKGGRGGRGALGTLGTAGGTGGLGRYDSLDANDIRPSNLYGSAGGAGGAGGAAGLSGHGAPGPAIALVFSGARPRLDGVKLIEGKGGEGAPALTRGAQTLAASVAEAKTEHSF